jgi:hypothetical protein
MILPHPTKEISLNIIALSAFTIMWGSLMAPLLHFSPLIPISLVMGLLIGTSLDNFFLQSRCAGLVLDTIARRDPAYVQRIIYHEAGHFLVAQQLGIAVTGYSLSAWEAWQQGQTGQGGVAFAPPPNPISGKLLQNYCAVWMAGVAAEQLMCGHSMGGHDDRQQLRSILKMAGGDPRSVAQAESVALLQAQEQLALQQPAFAALVQALQERQPVTVCLELITAA